MDLKNMHVLLASALTLIYIRPEKYSKRTIF